jgi:hypothetical protein
MEVRLRARATAVSSTLKPPKMPSFDDASRIQPTEVLRSE